ncbi:MAG: flagellar assembly protein FliH [Thiobacillus sp.]
MSNSVIPKEAQPACQPWELANFEVATHTVSSEDYDGVSLPTIDQITHIHEQARQEGYDAGRAEGLAEGLAEGRKLAAQEVARIRDVANAFSDELDSADEAISQQVLDLAVDLSRAMLKTALSIRPELVIPIVKEAVHYLPALHQPALLYLNPDDSVLIQERIGDELAKRGWQLTADPQLEAGGCRVETASNQIDASLPVRWQRLAAALGKDSEWLAP